MAFGKKIKTWLTKPVVVHCGYGVIIACLMTYFITKCSNDSKLNQEKTMEINNLQKTEEKPRDSIVKLNDMLELLKEYSQVHIEISDSSSNSGNVIVGHDNTIIVNNLDTNKAVIKAASQKVERRQKSVRDTTKQAQNQNQAENGSQVVSGMVYIYYNAPISR